MADSGVEASGRRMVEEPEANYGVSRMSPVIKDILEVRSLLEAARQEYTVGSLVELEEVTLTARWEPLVPDIEIDWDTIGNTTTNHFKNQGRLRQQRR